MRRLRFLPAHPTHSSYLNVVAESDAILEVKHTTFPTDIESTTTGKLIYIECQNGINYLIFRDSWSGTFAAYDTTIDTNYWVIGRR